MTLAYRHIRHVFILLCPVFLLSLLLCTKAYPEDAHEAAAPTPAPSISGISIVNDDRGLYVSFMLHNGFPPDVANALKSGISLTYIYDMRLESPGTLMDTTIVSRTLERRIKYDTLKNQYMVSFDPSSPRVIVVNSEKEARKLVSTVKHVLLVDLEALSRGESYRIRIRAGVEKEESAIAFSGIMNLFSSWGFETDWHEVVFNY